MVIPLLDALSFLLTLAIKFIFFILNIIRKVFIFILTNSLLRFLFILLIIGYFFNINFKFLATYFFIYLTHKSALKFNIYQRIYFNLKAFFQHLSSKHIVSKALKTLTTDHIILNNITVENYIDEHFTIDHLVICKGKIFIIKTFTYCDNNPLNLKNLLFNKTKDFVVDAKIIYSIINEINNCNNILRDILPFDIPITNVITLAKNNIVIKYDKNLNTPIVTIKSLVKFIQNNTNINNNYTSTSIKNFITENKTWVIDKVLFKTLYFLSNNKGVIVFFIIYGLLYYLYINLISILSG